ncbi:hypothetical protein ABZ527_31835 [Streptomyces griseofuscus]|uniref:hypothetical protein n=1 Tax=Streptomyces griseofuscus TaxID=146922 RepID=UPI0034007C8B
MTPLEEILSRALLVRDRTVPPDVVPPTHTGRCPRAPVRPVKVGATANTAAAQDLRALCEALVTHTPAAAVAAFVTEQLPEPRSAMVLACVLQLTDTDDGARFWWQYAAGAGQAAAAYCLYLHHLALGEEDAARWWHRQTDDVHPLSHDDSTAGRDRIDTVPTSTILRVLRHLARQTDRGPHSAIVRELMKYVPVAVAIGYLREPEIELPMPGSDFAGKIRSLLTIAARQANAPSHLPAGLETRRRRRHETTRSAAWIYEQVGEAATH